MSYKEEGSILKSYNHLFEQIITDENLKEAIQKSSNKKKDRKDVQDVLNNVTYHVKRIREILINNQFKVNKHVPKVIDDGFAHKKRLIIQPDYQYEQIIHHAIMQVLIPIFSKSMYKYSCGSIPKRGNSYGKKYIEKIIRTDVINTKYVLKIDIRKFFQNVNLDILKKKLKSKIHDDKVINIINIIIDSYDNGLPLGYFTSQWFANFYLQDLDYFIKQNMLAKYYIRYMDDMVIFASTKEELHYIKNAIMFYIQGNLDIELKDNWQVFKLSSNKKDNGRCLNFMGYKFYREKTILRKNILLKTTRKIRKILKKKKCTWYDATQLMSYYGWIKHTMSYNVFRKYFTDNHIYVKVLKKKISNHQKIININQIRLKEAA